MKLLGIGEVAKRTGIGIETIRYYEREELLAAPQRSPSGYRRYDESVVMRLRFIRRTKELGFTLSEIRELLGLWFSPHTKCAHIRERAKKKMVDVDEKIRSLQKMKRSLKSLISQCARRDSLRECPLLVGLDYRHNP